MTVHNRWRSTSANPVDPAFPTRRAVVGGALVAAAAWLLSYRPTPDPPWTRLTDKALWSPRDGAALLYHNDRLWLFGGSAKNQESDLADGWSSADGIDWRKEIDQAAWTPSTQSMGATFAGRMWRMGGFAKRDGRFLPINEIWSSVDGRNWMLDTANPDWEPRGGGALVVLHDRLWLLGGTRHPENKGNQTALSDVWWSENGVDWNKELSHAPWAPRAFHSAITHSGKLWVMGGGELGKNASSYSDVWSSPDGINWELNTEAAWPGRSWATAASYNGLLWIMGGLGPRGGSNDIWFSADGINWCPYLTSPKWAPRIGQVAAVFDGKLWLMAGSNTDYFNDVWYLNLPPGWLARSYLGNASRRAAVSWTAFLQKMKL